MQVALRYEFLESYWLLKGKFMEDRMIVERCLNGDTDSFEYLVTKYKKLVYSIALRFFNDPHLAEDVTQEVFFKAYRKLYMYDTNMKFSAWISRIAHNTCIDTLRKNKNYSVSAEENPVVEDTAEAADEILVRKEKKHWLEEQIRVLKPDYKTPLLLFHQAGLSYEEIAKTMNVPLSIVKNRIYRARKMLKEKMAEYYREA
ncbi:sigma-70 family RNA polymerase sigma factor [Thermoclostridium stercorarium]|uniref:RNA polymerase sigma factor n=1 Tax=Thermoclostridium stercorarium TaxID=1510 RepID=UPI0022498DFF|nr:sigma-70 family RNA polymerase sigma factor [Thermoclostridium stercorarium]UZQ85339.1 sigma-70 family RNA polymerase sigma factor [Thermoclostridium stercorarium]